MISHIHPLIIIIRTFFWGPHETIGNKSVVPAFLTLLLCSHKDSLKSSLYKRIMYIGVGVGHAPDEQ